MKRIGIVLLCAAMLTACGNRKQEEKTVKKPEPIVITTQEENVKEEESSKNEVKDQSVQKAETPNECQQQKSVPQVNEEQSNIDVESATNKRAAIENNNTVHETQVTPPAPSNNTTEGEDISNPARFEGGVSSDTSISTPDGWISEDGYYHRSDYCDGHVMTGQVMMWHEAQECGYLPCPDCNPK